MPDPAQEQEQRERLWETRDGGSGYSYVERGTTEHGDLEVLVGPILHAAACRVEEWANGVLSQLQTEREQRERLRERADELEDALVDMVETVTALDNALAICDSKAQRNSDGPNGDEWVGSYYLKCGPWHRVLGIRHDVARALGDARNLFRDRDAAEPRHAVVTNQHRAQHGPTEKSLPSVEREQE